MKLSIVLAFACAGVAFARSSGKQLTEPLYLDPFCHNQEDGTRLPSHVCGSFFVCKNQMSQLHNCDKGLVFNYESGLCDWPENVNCETQMPLSDLPDCTRSYGQAFANPSECASYYFCENATPILKQCGEGLLFDTTVRTCNWGPNVACTTRSVPKRGKVSHHRNAPNCGGMSGIAFAANTCDAYYVCEHGIQEAVLKQCEQGMLFDSFSGVCSSESHVLCNGQIVDVPAHENTETGNYIGAPNCVGESGTAYAASTCDTYFFCQHGVDKAILKTCDHGLLFDAVSKTCNWAESVQCDLQTSEIVAQEQTEIAEHVEQIEQIEPIPQIEHNAIDCTGMDGHLFAATECSSFYICENDVAVMKQCNKGLLFDATMGVCNWPHNVNCNAMQSVNEPNELVFETAVEIASETPVEIASETPVEIASETPVEIIPEQETTNQLSCVGQNGHSFPGNACDTYFICENDVAVFKHCDIGLFYDANHHVCNWSPPGTCKNIHTQINKDLNDYPKECPANEDNQHPTHLPHPIDCTKFYKCWEGVAVVQDCPEGQHWSTERDWCDYPWEANCVRPLL